MKLTRWPPETSEAAANNSKDTQGCIPHIPSWRIRKSYGNKLRDLVQTSSQKRLPDMPSPRIPSVDESPRGLQWKKTTANGNSPSIHHFHRGVCYPARHLWFFHKIGKTFPPVHPLKIVRKWWLAIIEHRENQLHGACFDIIHLQLSKCCFLGGKQHGHPQGSG